MSAFEHTNVRLFDLHLAGHLIQVQGRLGGLVTFAVLGTEDRPFEGETPSEGLRPSTGSPLPGGLKPFPNCERRKQRQHFIWFFAFCLRSSPSMTQTHNPHTGPDRFTRARAPTTRQPPSDPSGTGGAERQGAHLGHRDRKRGRRCTRGPTTARAARAARARSAKKQSGWRSGWRRSEGPEVGKA